MTLIPGKENKYLCSDSSCALGRNDNNRNDIHTYEFLITVNSSGLPIHELRLKIDV